MMKSYAAIVEDDDDEDLDNMQAVGRGTWQGGRRAGGGGRFQLALKFVLRTRENSSRLMRFHYSASELAAHQRWHVIDSLMRFVKRIVTASRW